MLYLAEVQKQKGGLLGGGSKTELKLLACQRTDQSWSGVSAEEVIPDVEANKLNDGALVFAEVNNRQVQRIQEAGRPLVNILQNFSRQLEKFKLKEEEIDQWKESLTFQAQELNRREMDLEVRSEELQQLEEDAEKLSTDRQELETNQQLLEQLQAEIQRNREELAGAWEQLRGEQRRLEEQKADLPTGAMLDEQQSRGLQELLARLSGGVAPTSGLQEDLNLATEMLARSCAILTPHWQQLEEQKTTAEAQQSEIDQLAQTHSCRLEEWQSAQSSLEQAIVELKSQTTALDSKQGYAQMLNLQLRNSEEIYQQILQLAEKNADVNIGEKVEFNDVLDRMSLDELQRTVQDLQRDLERGSSFVNDQEEELKSRQHTIAELQQKLALSPEHERLNIATEIAEEQDLYQMLNETLVGQRRNLLERQHVLRQHLAALRNRQGGGNNTAAQINLSPILAQIEAQQQKHTEELQQLEMAIEQLRSTIQRSQAQIDERVSIQQAQRQELQSMEQDLLSQKAAIATSSNQINLYQDLQPIQDSLDQLRSQLSAIASTTTQVQEAGDRQLQDIAEIRQTLMGVMGIQLAVS